MQREKLLWKVFLFPVQQQTPAWFQLVPVDLNISLHNEAPGFYHMLSTAIDMNHLLILMSLSGITLEQDLLTHSK